MIIGGKTLSLADCMVKVRVLPEVEKAPIKNSADYIWIAYDDSKAKLPIAMASSAIKLAEMMGVDQNTVYSVWSRYKSGGLLTAKYARVYVGENYDAEASD